MKRIYNFLIFLFCFGSLSGQNIVSVVPGQGSQGQTLTVTITGQNTHFNQASATNIWFSQGSSTLIYPASTTAISATQIQSLFHFTYSDPSGYYQVNSYNYTDGHLFLPNGFYLNPGANPPALVSVNPSGGNQGQTLTVTVSGQNTHFNSATSTNFYFSQGSSTIIYPTSSSIISATQLQAQFSFNYQNPTGYYQANQYNPTDGQLFLTNSFLLSPGGNPPALVLLTPNGGSQGQNLTVTISGQNTHFNSSTSTNFYLSQGSSTLIYPTSSSIISATQLQAQFSFNYQNPTGYYQANQYNPTDGQLFLTNSFLLSPGGNPPALVSVTPSSGSQGQFLSVSITGQNTHFQQSNYTLSFQHSGGTTIYPLSSSAISNTLIQANLFLSWNYPTGPFTTQVENIADGYLGLPNSFNILPSTNYPALVLVTPDSAQASSSVEFTIHGINTHFLVAGSNAVYLQGQNYFTDYSPLVLSDTLMKAHFNLSWAPSGYYILSVYNIFDANLAPYANPIYITQLPIGIEKNKPQQFSCYPNPFTHEIFLGKPGNEIISQVKCFNVTGQLMFLQIPGSQTFPLRLETDPLAPGVYYLEIAGRDKTEVMRILKQ